MIPFPADEPPDEPCTSGECRRCHRALTDPVSLGFSIGPTRRERLGITSRRRAVRLARVRAGGEVEGQGDLLGEER